MDCNVPFPIISLAWSRDVREEGKEKKPFFQNLIDYMNEYMVYLPREMDGAGYSARLV